jgi:hypothetical protein
MPTGKVQVPVLYDNHRVVAPDGGDKQVIRLLRGGRQAHPDTGNMRQQRLQALRVLRTGTRL